MVIYKPHFIASRNNQVKLLLKEKMFDPPGQLAVFKVDITAGTSGTVTIYGNQFNLVPSLPPSNLSAFFIHNPASPTIALNNFIFAINENQNRYRIRFFVATKNYDCLCVPTEPTILGSVYSVYIVGYANSPFTSTYPYTQVCIYDSPNQRFAAAWACIELEGSYLQYGNYVSSPILNSTALKRSDFFRWGEKEPIDDVCDDGNRYFIFEFKDFCTQFAFQPPPLVQIGAANTPFTPRTCDYALKKARIKYGYILDDGLSKTHIIDNFFVLNSKLPEIIYNKGNGRWGQDDVQVNLGVTYNWLNAYEKDELLSNPDLLSSYRGLEGRRFLTMNDLRHICLYDIDYVHILLPLVDYNNNLASFKLRVTRFFADGSSDTYISSMDFSEVLLEYQEYLPAKPPTDSFQQHIIQVPIYNLWAEKNWDNVTSFCLDFVYQYPLAVSTPVETSTDTTGNFDGSFSTQPPIYNPYLLLGAAYTQQPVGGLGANQGYGATTYQPSNTNQGAIYRILLGIGTLTFAVQTDPSKYPTCEYYYTEIWFRVNTSASNSWTVMLETSGCTFVAGNRIINGVGATGWQRLHMFTLGFPKRIPGGQPGALITMRSTRGTSTFIFDAFFMACAESQIETISNSIKYIIDDCACVGERETILWQNEFGVPECLSFDRIFEKKTNVEAINYNSNNNFLPISLDDRKNRTVATTRKDTISLVRRGTPSEIREWLKSLYESPNIYYLRKQTSLSVCGLALPVPPDDTNYNAETGGADKEPMGVWIPIKLVGEEFALSDTEQFQNLILTFELEPERRSNSHFKI